MAEEASLGGVLRERHIEYVSERLAPDTSGTRAEDTGHAQRHRLGREPVRLALHQVRPPGPCAVVLLAHPSAALPSDKRRPAPTDPCVAGAGIDVGLLEMGLDHVHDVVGYLRPAPPAVDRQVAVGRR